MNGKKIKIFTLIFFSYGKIVSTKAILDKNTNQCKGIYKVSHYTKCVQIDVFLLRVSCPPLKGCLKVLSLSIYFHFFVQLRKDMLNDSCLKPDRSLYCYLCPKLIFPIEQHVCKVEIEGSTHLWLGAGDSENHEHIHFVESTFMLFEVQVYLEQQ